MAKPSARKPAPAPIPAKATKIRLNRHAKDTLLNYMVTQFDSRIDDTELTATLDDILSRTNTMLRAKYPEDDRPDPQGRPGYLRIDTVHRRLAYEAIGPYSPC